MYIYIYYNGCILYIPYMYHQNKLNVGHHIYIISFQIYIHMLLYIMILYAYNIVCYTCMHIIYIIELYIVLYI